MPHKDMALAMSRAGTIALAPSAPRTRSGSTTDACAPPTRMSKASSARSISAAPGWDKRGDSAVVLGAGGAARAVVYGLIERGMKTIHVVNRTFGKAELLRERFGASVHPAHVHDIPRLLDGAKLLVNATALGMKGQPDHAIDLHPYWPTRWCPTSCTCRSRPALQTAAERRGVEDRQRSRHAAAPGGARL